MKAQFTNTPEILILAESPRTCEGLEILLKGLEFDTRITWAVQDVFELLEKRDFDLLVLDMAISEKTGFQVLDFMRSRKPECAVIALARANGPDTVRKHQEHGAIDCLEKPFRTSELLRSVRYALQLWRMKKERARIKMEKRALEAQLQQARKMEALGSLTGWVAQDIKNLLGVIVGNTELVLGDVPEWNPIRHNMEEIHKACLRAQDTMNQVLIFYRNSKGENEPVMDRHSRFTS